MSAPASTKFLLRQNGACDFQWREINDLKSLDEALELGVVEERGKGLVAL
jgi:hypothetical protein